MSAIEWTDKTWNPVTGCDRASAGCDHCYALVMARRLKAMGNAKYQRDGNPRTSGPGFGVTIHPDVLDLPRQWKRPQRIFVNSMSDLFHPEVPEDLVAKVWTVMAATPHHTYQILTKRHARMRSIVRRIAWRTPTTEERRAGVRGPVAYVQRDESLNDHLGQPRVLPNVWLGVSVEDQRWAETRIPALLETPAAVRWISAEPLIGPIDLSAVTCPCGGRGGATGYSHLHGCHMDMPCGLCDGVGRGAALLDWVVVGGESGAKARPLHPDWVRSLRDQCKDSCVPFLFKQWGTWQPTGMLGIGRPAPGRIYVGPPVDAAGHRVEMARVGKGAAGRELDGQVWDENPAPVAEVPAPATF